MGKETPAQFLARLMREKAGEQGHKSMMTHTPDGGSIIYVGPEEDDVAGVLMSSAAQIIQKRQE